MKKTYAILLFLMIVVLHTQAQKVMKLGNNNGNINSSALLELEATNKGLLLPRIALNSTADVSTISIPAIGLLIYNTQTAGDVTPGLYIYNGAAWNRLAASLSGNYIASLNGLSGGTQTFAIGTSGTDFNIVSAGTTHTFNFPTASAVNRGLISAADWTSFSTKQNAITTGSALQYLKGDLSLGTFPTTVSNFTNDAGYLTSLTGEVTTAGLTATVTNAAVIGKLLTGYTSAAGTVSASDNILQAIEKLNGNDILKAPLASPALTGTPTAPTAAISDNSTTIATTAFVKSAVTSVTVSDATTGSKGLIQLSGDLSGTAALPTITNTAVITKVLTGYTSGAGTLSATDNVLQAIQKLNGNDLLKAPLASPALTGTPTAPTVATSDNSTTIATTAFVKSAVASSTAGVSSITGTVNQITASASTGAVTLSLPSTVSITGLSVSSNAALASLSVTSNASVGGNLTVTGFSASSGTPQFNSVKFPGGGRTVTVQASGSTSSSYTLTLPTASGSNGQVLQTNGSGTTSWVNPSGVSGVTQFYGGTTGLTTTSGGATGVVTLTGTLNVANGGTGATTLTGLVKGNGTSAFTPAVAGTDYQAPLTAGTDYQAPLTASTGIQILNGIISATGTTAGITSLAGLTTDVSITTTPTNGQLLQYNSTTGKWVPVNGALSSLTADVAISSPVTGDALEYNGSKWVNVSRFLAQTFSTSSSSIVVNSTNYPNLISATSVLKAQKTIVGILNTTGTTSFTQNTISVTLPDATKNMNKEIILKPVFSVTPNTNSAWNIDNVYNYNAGSVGTVIIDPNLANITNLGAPISFISDGTSWYLISAR